MTDLAPYHFQPEELPDGLQRHLVGTDTFLFREVEYTYGIIAPEVAPSVPNFTGMWGGQNLIVSKDVIHNTHLRTATLSHEILCNRLYARRPDHSCPMVENEILAPFAPFPNILFQVVDARLAMFRALIPYNKIDPAHPKNHFEEGIVGTWRYLENLARGQRIAENTD